MLKNELDRLNIDKSTDVDVCVIGAAGGGLSAALAAYEAGAKRVTILEKAKAPGGATRMCGGFFGVGSPAQKRLGIQDTADDCFRQIIAHLNWNVDVKLVRDWMRGSSETVSWLESKGMIFDYVKPFQAYPDVARSTYHVTKSKDMHTGIEIVNTLVAECESKGISIMTQTRAKNLVTDTHGKVVGVYAVSRDGQDNESGIMINAGSVIIATGSISSNKELISRFYSGDSYSDVKIMANIPHNTGDGFIMAEEVGAKAGEIATLFIGPHNHGVDSSELTGVIMRRPQPMKVNRYGERFIDESIFTDTDFGSMLSLCLDRQPGKICYIVLDEAMLSDMIDKDEKINFLEEYVHSFISRDDRYRHGGWMGDLRGDIEKEAGHDRVKVCDTVEDAADWIGCDRDTLKLTLEEYNAFCDDGYDADFLKPARHLIPLRTPPFYIIKGPSGIDTCIGGIQVDRNLSVVNMDSEPIPGLYAAGVCTSGWLNRGYAYQGSELSFTLYSGRTAGKRAAESSLGILPKKPLYNIHTSAKTFVAGSKDKEPDLPMRINDKCIGCGSCDLVCEAGAIYTEDGEKFHIHADICTGCGLCAETCSYQAIVEMK